MITDDQVVALFADANPVPSLDLLDPVEPVDPGHLTNRSERGRDMTELKTIELDQPAPRRRLVPVLLTLAIALVLVPVAIGSLEIVGGAGTQSEQIATAFMEAVASYDGEAALELFSPDGDHNDEPPALIVGYSDFDRAIELERTYQGCNELTPVSFPDGSRADAVECTFMIQTAAGEAMGFEPSTGTFQVYIENGQILRTYEVWDSPHVGEIWIAFLDWVQESHPTDYETMYQDPNSPRTDSEAIALWEQFTAEFVAEMEG